MNARYVEHASGHTLKQLFGSLLETSSAGVPDYGLILKQEIFAVIENILPGS